MRLRRIYFLVGFLALVICLIPFRAAIWSAAMGLTGNSNDRKTVSDRVSEFGELVHQRLAPRFSRVGMAYPPKHLTLVAMKQERMLEIWVAGQDGEFRLLETLPILSASGTLGPKLAEGDRQVPEGLYRIESLNPNSSYHLALRVNYPNSFDKAKGKLDGRVNFGSDIMIHGGSASVGCLAMGDQGAEDLFVLAAETGINNITLILSPMDLRTKELPATQPNLPSWTPELYAQIKEELRRFKR
jgi:hypothetical protein